VNINDQIDYLRKKRVIIPVIRTATINPQIRMQETIDLSQIVSFFEYQFEFMRTENKDLKDQLLDCILHANQLAFIRNYKRELLEKYFPDLIKDLPYYQGGDHIGSDEKP